MAHLEHNHHVQPVWIYIRTFVLLGILMGLTILAAELPHLGFKELAEMSWVNNFVAMAIAVTKALLVINIFMGVKFQTKLVKLYAFGGFVASTLLAILFCDYATRGWEQTKGWENLPTNVMPRAEFRDP